MDLDSEAAGECNPLRIYEVALRASNPMKHVDVMFFAAEPPRERNSRALEKDEDLVPILAAFVHEKYPTCTLVGVL